MQQYKKRMCQGTDWLSASMQNGPGAAEFQHSLGLEPKSPESLLPALTTKPFVLINCLKKWYMTRRISPPATNFLQYRTVGFFNLNMKARHEIREFLRILEHKPLIDTFNVDWS